MEAMSANAIRVHEYEGQRAFQMLRDCPDMQAEQIANHYTKLALLAMDLRKCVEIRRYADLHGWALDNADAMIARMVQEIKQQHWYDFGIPLEWRHAERVKAGYANIRDREADGLIG